MPVFGHYIPLRRHVDCTIFTLTYACHCLRRPQDNFTSQNTLSVHWLKVSYAESATGGLVSPLASSDEGNWFERLKSLKLSPLHSNLKALCPSNCLRMTPPRAKGGVSPKGRSAPQWFPLSWVCVQIKFQRRHHVLTYAELCTWLDRAHREVACIPSCYGIHCPL